MSRYIDPNRPYTEEEKEYLLTRSNGPSLINVNERKFSHLSAKEKGELTSRNDDDEAKERQIEEAIDKAIQEEESDSYHPEDIAFVEPLKIAELRRELEREGLNPKVSDKDKAGDGDPMTEKEVLAYRLLNRLDEKRSAAQA